MAFPWLEGHSGAGLAKAIVSHGVRGGVQPDTKVERMDIERSVSLI